jgi:HprK-related kinase A
LTPAVAPPPRRRLRELGPGELALRLRREGLGLEIGPFAVRIRSDVEGVAQGIAVHYAEHPVLDDPAFVDFHVGVQRPTGLRRWWRPQALFRFDGQPPFAPLPLAQGLPLLEWGLNWTFSAHAHQYLILHAAVVERGGLAVVMPAPPGSGKSTLCAALAHAGWRLFSDELALVDPQTLALTASPRPISLKNASIDVIRAQAPSAVFTPAVQETQKGTIAHAKPPADAVHRAHEPAEPAWIVLPRWAAAAEPELRPLPKARALALAIDNTFNFPVHRRAGFHALRRLVDRCECFELPYADLRDAVALLDARHRARTGASGADGGAAIGRR